ncbi:Chromosomal replication initiator protein DnaA [Planctomycetes bacterium CA13]|uniref:Chromosomal replication initiator protein DnaA n=1 Tax=Novipirellula herctigrandis TaxID=2527986 RepID=A0A5C5YYV5_9BACT|nr:Chromosomal replication initiator protein DnaA [Planctomycetes bacterium CA13]
MKEDCATVMSASQGCIDDTAVVEKFKEALKERIGADRFQMWFHHGVSFSLQSASSAAMESEAPPSPTSTCMVESAVTSDTAVTMDSAVTLETDGTSALEYSHDESPSRIVVLVSGQFALDRLKQNFMQPIRAAAAQVFGTSLGVALELQHQQAVQSELPLQSESDEFADADEFDPAAVAEYNAAKKLAAKTRTRTSQRNRGNAKSLSSLVSDGAGTTRKPTKRRREPCAGQPSLPNFGGEAQGSQNQATGKQAIGSGSSHQSNKPMSAAAALRATMTLKTFVGGQCNQLAHTAAMMACQSPSTATPLFLYGPSGIGKSHLINAIADQFRRGHRMRRVVQISGEKFTNDFCKSVGGTGLPEFRKRYRDVDALLIDDVQFLSSKSATLREMLYTVEALIEAGRPIVFSANQAPSEIEGLSRELIGRMASGLVCPMHSLDNATRGTVLRGLISERCSVEWPEATITEVNSQLAGDGRVLSGVVNLVATLQKMLSRMPSMDEIRQFGGDLLRTSQPTVTLTSIERAVCEAFSLPADELRGTSQARAICEPRMLAMYLSRQMTSSAYAQIAGHFGGRSHSTAIAAERNVNKWLAEGKSIGRGAAAISAREAIHRLETLLRTG